ncbi:DcrB-related protein [Burkholderia pyrrocinia]|uniref:DcrB-related protein n=1 Tax=Burkholderia pyrrocinia TaxID=60550 RepID=UPI0030D5AD42
MPYQMQEGTLELPREWQDKTMNVFVSSATGTEGVSFVVTREPLPWGMKFDEYAAKEIDKLARTVPEYTLINVAEQSVSDRAAHSHEFKWTNNGAAIHQQMTMVEYGPTVLVLTFTSPGIISDSQREQMTRVIQSLQLRVPN